MDSKKCYRKIDLSDYPDEAWWFITQELLQNNIQHYIELRDKKIAGSGHVSLAKRLYKRFYDNIYDKDKKEYVIALNRDETDMLLDVVDEYDVHHRSKVYICEEIGTQIDGRRKYYEK